jgi:RHS repeat-associated protein
VVLSYAYTNNRLLATESVTTLPSGVDGTVQSIAHTYDNLNRPLNDTSYASTGGTGTVINDIQYAYYNGTTKPITSYQEHKGAVNTSTSLNVQYTYDTTTTGSIYSNQLRIQTEVHPNSRAIYYDYGSSSGSTAAYNATSTVREIWDGSPSGTGLAVYDYNGVRSRLAMATYPQPSFKLDHFEGTSGTYAALDRFGRIVDQYWGGFGGTGDVDRVRYADDYAGSPSYRQISPSIYPAETLDQAYTYDTLHRLMTSKVGTLSGTTISGTPASEEDWSLDGIGNWAGYVQNASGTTTLNQTRTASAANSISNVTASVGSSWTTPSYDLAGNMTSIPIPSSPTSGFTASYDAWNRLISLTNGTTTVATYAYDGLSRRIVKSVYVTGVLDHNEHAYFNEHWQLIELRKEVSGTINVNPLEQYGWHPFFVDALILRDYDPTTSGSPTRYYYAFDANFNVTAVTSATGTTAERYYYSPYGMLTFLNASFTSLASQQSQIGNTLTYTGHVLDAESGLYYCRNRYFHPALGAFASRDPIGYSFDDLNLFRYCVNRPTLFFDLDGLQGTMYPGSDAPPGAYRRPWQRERPTSGPYAPKPVPAQPTAPQPTGPPPTSQPYSPQADPFSPTFDPTTLDKMYWQNWDFFQDFKNGTGVTNRTYDATSFETFQMAQSPGAAMLRYQFYSGGAQSISAFNYSTGQAANDTLLDPLGVPMQVGGFGNASAINNSDGTVTFTIPNDASRQSFLYHLPVQNRAAGPMRTIHQTFTWTETINKQYCPSK